MSLDELIAEGEMVRKECAQPGSMVKEFLSGEKYEKWISKGLFFMENNHKNSTLYGRFLQASKEASGNSTSYYDTMIGVLKAIKESE